jgi:hypothetical protein
VSGNRAERDRKDARLATLETPRSRTTDRPTQLPLTTAR